MAMIDPFYLLVGVLAVGGVVGLIWIHRMTDIEGGGDDPWRFRRR